MLSTRGTLPLPRQLSRNSTSMFLNLFIEAEPFAAILLAHVTHVFWGTLEAQRAEIRRQRPRVGGVLGEGQRAPSPPARKYGGEL